MDIPPHAESFAPADIRQVDGWIARRTRSPSRLLISARSTDGDPAARRNPSRLLISARSTDGDPAARRNPSRLLISARSTEGDPAARGVLRACRYPPGRRMEIPPHAESFAPADIR